MNPNLPTTAGIKLLHTPGPTHVPDLVRNAMSAQPFDLNDPRLTAVVDTLDGYYTGFAEQMQQTYGDFRRTSYEEIDKEDRARASARARTILGVAAVAASIFAPSSCNSNATCNLDSAVRYGAAAGGVASFLSGLKKYADAKTHAQAFSELARSFQAEVSTQVVEVEGRSLRLTGSAEEQYREWRRLLREYQSPDGSAGAPATAADAASSADVTTPATATPAVP